MFKKKSDTNKYIIYKQEAAFVAGLKAYKYFKEKGIKVVLNMFVDHKLSIDLFLNPNANTNKPHYLLADLKETIIEIYNPFLMKYDLTPESINILFEKRCRNQFNKWLKVLYKKLKKMDEEEKQKIENYIIAASIQKPNTEIDKEKDCKIDLYLRSNENNTINQIACKGIIAYTMKNANDNLELKNKNGLILCLWGKDADRCESQTIIGGEEIAKGLLNVKSSIANILDINLSNDLTEIYL